MTTVQRNTRETRIHASISDDSTLTSIDTSIPFLDHMLHTLARYSGLGVVVEARGDLRHHIAEDVAICLGKALSSFATTTCARYGDRTIPMDDALVQCVLDLGGRPYYRGPLPNRLYDHWFRSFCDNAGATIHLRVIRGRDRHHIIEASFKALGLALSDALQDTDAVFSTKGSAVVGVEP